MTILGWIVYLIGSAGFWWVEFQDAKWSNYYDLTTTGEANWWSRGDDGYFDLKKSLMWTGLYFAGVTAFALFAPWEYAPLFAGGFLGAVAAILWFGVIAKNVKKHRGRRDEQLAILANIKRDPDNAKAYLGKAKHFQGHDKRTYWIFSHFYDLRVLSTFQVPEGVFHDFDGKVEAARVFAEAQLIPRFIALAKMDTSVHFARDRNTKV